MSDASAYMRTDARVFVAGHRGMVGSALVRKLRGLGHTNILTRAHDALDLADKAATRRFFEAERPDFVFLAAAKVGGIHANDAYPADFISQNLAIQSSVIEASHAVGVDRLQFLGSSCIYPKLAPQPMKEEHLLTGPLEPTNRAYALAKIAGVEMCWSYNRQFRTRYLAVMPTNLYGPGDTYHPENSHVIPGMIRRLHEAKVAGAPSVTIWGTGAPRREFLFSDDMAAACVHLMNLPDERYLPLLGQDRNDGLAPLVNIGVGDDLTIRELAETLQRVVGFAGALAFDVSKPDGTPRKLLDVTRLTALGWTASTPLLEGLGVAYDDFLANHL
ncbi:MAG: GDP-L-fucose synthetase [Hyphomicrobiales bacterium]|nr:GDP-L-fucose synthetase [Hyphomicrobiales bacterium]